MALIGRTVGAAGSIYGGISASLVEAIIEALDIDYNGKQRSNVLAVDRSASQEREQGSPGDSTSGERGESGEQSADGTGGAVSSDNERRGQGNLQDTARRQQDDLAQAGEVDENGHLFVKSSDGTTTFGYIKADSGLTPAPIKLSEGFNNKDEKGNNIGYGRVHIDEGHGEQIREAGYASIEEFVEKVARDYKEIRIGRDRKSNQTYMLLELHDEKHNATLYVELSRNGEYWNVNSGGVFKKKYTDKNDIVWPLPTVGSDTNTDIAEVAGSPVEAVEGETANRGGNSSQPISSEGKDTQSSGNEQENGEKKSQSERTTDSTPVRQTLSEKTRKAY